jgi:flagellar motor switch/type III secretory pathway protein FliN
MSEPCYKFVGENSPCFQSSQVFFNNLNLDYHVIKESLAPIIEIICHRIESTYKSPSKIDYVGLTYLLKKRISDYMQLDDICIKLWHTESATDIFLTLGTRLARTLLIRLLATSLIDDAHPSLFSSTEKGIFSFIVARLLFDLKNALCEKMPTLKLTGIYHCQDKAFSDASIDRFGVISCSLTFGASIYPIMIFVHPKLFNTIKTQKNTLTNLFDRCGHLKRSLIFRLNTLNVSLNTISVMSFGDLIIFDHCRQEMINKALRGPIHATWQDLAILGKLDVAHGVYRFLVDGGGFQQIEGNIMEELEISHPANSEAIDLDLKTKNKKLAELAKNIRVSLSIELSRLPMTLKELCDIREGEIIDLHRKIEDPLEMVVENKIIGYCQPVQIDGRLGIRILRIDSEQQNQV